MSDNRLTIFIHTNSDFGIDKQLEKLINGDIKDKIDDFLKSNKLLERSGEDLDTKTILGYFDRYSKQIIKTSYNYCLSSSLSNLIVVIKDYLNNFDETFRLTSLKVSNNGDLITCECGSENKQVIVDNIETLQKRLQDDYELVIDDVIANINRFINESLLNELKLRHLANGHVDVYQGNQCLYLLHNICEVKSNLNADDFRIGKLSVTIE